MKIQVFSKKAVVPIDLKLDKRMNQFNKLCIVICIPSSSRINFERKFFLANVLGYSLVDNGRANPSCAEDQTIDVAGGKAYFCRMKGRYIVITKDTKPANDIVHVVEIFVNPSHQSKILTNLMVSICLIGKKHNHLRYTGRLKKRNANSKAILFCIFSVTIKNNIII